MSTKSLREGLKSLIETDALSDQEYQQLLDMQPGSRDREDGLRSPGRWSRRGFLFGGGAAVAASLMWVSGRAVLGNREAIQQGIIREVLTNHIQIRALDIETDSINELARFFDQLDFSPYLSSQLQGRFELLGGRYCTLQGVIASQLRLRRTGSGEVVTYYQARYDREHFGRLPDTTTGAQPEAVYERGYEMSIWRESNVVNILTQSAA